MRAEMHGELRAAGRDSGQLAGTAIVRAGGDTGSADGVGADRQDREVKNEKEAGMRTPPLFRLPPFSNR